MNLCLCHLRFFFVLALVFWMFYFVHPRRVNQMVEEIGSYVPAALSVSIVMGIGISVSIGNRIGILFANV